MSYVINETLSIKDYNDKIEVQENDYYTKIYKKDILSITKNNDFANAVENILNKSLINDAKSVINNIMNCYEK